MPAAAKRSAHAKKHRENETEKNRGRCVAAAVREILLGGFVFFLACARCGSEENRNPKCILMVYALLPMSVFSPFKYKFSLISILASPSSNDPEVFT
jgi:hypothetical protein